MSAPALSLLDGNSLEGRPAIVRVRSSEIPISHAAQITVRPCASGPDSIAHAFRCDRIAIPRLVAECFRLEDLKIGYRSQFRASEIYGTLSARFAADIPASWAALAAGPRGQPDCPIEISPSDLAEVMQLGAEFRTETVQTAMDVDVLVALTGARPAIFECYLIGIAAFSAPPTDRRPVARIP